jgi:hypothetical protein
VPVPQQPSPRGQQPSPRGGAASPAAGRSYTPPYAYGANAAAGRAVGVLGGGGGGVAKPPAGAFAAGAGLNKAGLAAGEA